MLSPRDVVVLILLLLMLGGEHLGANGVWLNFYVLRTPDELNLGRPSSSSPHMRFFSSYGEIPRNPHTASIRIKLYLYCYPLEIDCLFAEWPKCARNSLTRGLEGS